MKYTDYLSNELWLADAIATAINSWGYWSASASCSLEARYKFIASDVIKQAKDQAVKDKSKLC